MYQQGFQILGVKIGVTAPQNVPKTDQNLRRASTFGQKWRTFGQNIFSLKQTGSTRLNLPGNGVSHLILDARTAEQGCTGKKYSLFDAANRPVASCRIA